MRCGIRPPLKRFVSNKKETDRDSNTLLVRPGPGGSALAVAARVVNLAAASIHCSVRITVAGDHFFVTTQMAAVAELPFQLRIVTDMIAGILFVASFRFLSCTPATPSRFRRNLCFPLSRL